MSETEEVLPVVGQPVDPVALQDILIRIQSLLPLIRDRDLLVQLTEEFQIEVEDEADINQVKVHLLTYLLGNFAGLQNTPGILDKLYGIFETLTNHITEAEEAERNLGGDGGVPVTRRREPSLGNANNGARRDTVQGDNAQANLGNEDQNAAGILNGVNGSHRHSRGVGRGRGDGGFATGGITASNGVFASNNGLLGAGNGVGRGGALGRGGLGYRDLLDVKPPPLYPHRFSTPMQQRFHRPPGMAVGAGGGGQPPHREVRSYRIRDFKISGQIGEPGQADKLTFSNLLHQIMTARTQQYSDAEIIAAIVKACTPGLSLRTYLEGRPGIGMLALMTILRTHFKEKDATAVFNDMGNASQGPKETENSFCLRMMGLRDKVMLLTAEEGNLYDARLVQTQFQHALYTGLRNENARHALHSILKRTNLSDEDLLVAINEYMMNAAEHKAKTENSKQMVNKIQPKNDGNEPNNRLANKAANKEKENTLLTQVTKTVDQISQLTAKVNELSSKVQEITSKHTKEEDKEEFPGLGRGDRATFFRWGNDGFCPPWGGPMPVRGGFGGQQRGRGRGSRGGGFCSACRASNENRCPHCFKCGETGHKKEDCPKN